MLALLATLALLLTLSLSPAHAQAASLTVGWNADASAPGFVVLRCQVPAGSATCVPQSELPGPLLSRLARTFVDSTVSPGSTYCWTVEAADAQGQRSAPATTTAGVPYFCKTVPGTSLPPPGAATVAVNGSHLLLTWSLPIFSATTVPASALTRFEIWRRDDKTPSTARTVATVAATTTSWDDLTPLPGANGYWIRAVYGTMGAAENNTVWATVPPAPPGLVAPTNLHEVLPTAPAVPKRRAKP